MFRKITLFSIVILFTYLVEFTQSGVLDWFGGSPSGPQNSTDNGSVPLNNGSDPLNVLRFVCDIYDGTSEDVTINTLPTYCTAVATSQNDEGVVKNMSAIKTTTMPFIKYFNEFKYDDWDSQLSDVEPFITTMKEDGLDGLIFDNLYQNDVEHYDVAKNRKIYTFFQNLKESSPKGLFGLALPRHAGILPTAFDYSNLDKVIDFYVIQTVHYRECTHDFIMKKTCTVGDMEKSLKALSESITLKKVLLTIQVYSIGIASTLSFATHGEVLITYSDMCHYKGKELSKSRKYCKDSIKSLYKKGQLVPKYEMLGAYIQYIDYDDFAGCCDCKDPTGNSKFPGTAAIISGINPNGTQPENCKTFGNYDGTAPSSSSSEGIF